MRISDWSSDVCSSDLPSASVLLRICEAGKAPTRKEARAMGIAETVDLSEGLRARQVAAQPIPLVDFAPFLAGDTAARRRVAMEIGRACREIGFFYLVQHRSEEHTSELQSLMRNSYAVFC